MRIALVGELDLVDVGALDERLDGIVAEHLVVDLNGVVFADSAALRCLFRLAAKRGRSGLAFVIEEDAPIAKTLEIVALRRAAPLARTTGEALEALSRPAGL